MNRVFPILVLVLFCSCSQSPVMPPPSEMSSWTVFATSEHLTGATGIPGECVYILGSAGTILRHDGFEWEATMPFDASFHGTNLWCVSSRGPYVAGYSRKLVSGAWSNDYRLYQLNGSAADRVDIELGGPVGDLWSRSENNIYVAGTGGMIQHFDGSSWQQLESGTTEDIRAIQELPTGELLTASKHAVQYHDTSRWKEILTTDATLLDIWATSREDVYAAVKENGSILRFDGRTWQVLTTRHGDVQQVLILASDDVWATSGLGWIHHFDGASWQTAALPIRSLRIHALWGVAKSDVIAVGIGDDDQVGPTVLHFDGTAWSREAVDALLPFNGELTALSGNAHELHLGGDFMALLRFDGMSWNRCTGDDAGHISDIWSGPRKSLVAIGDYGHEVALFDDTNWSIRTGAMVSGDGHEGVWASALNDVFFVGALGEIVHFNGITFERMPSHTTALLNDVWGRSGTDVYAVGDSGTILHFDGLTWQHMETPTTASLRAIWGDAGIAVAAGDGGTILHLTDGEWMQADCPTSADLTGVWGISSTEVYAIGAAAILRYDGSRWGLLRDAPGGRRIWGRAGDDLYILDSHSFRILHYAPVSLSASE